MILVDTSVLIKGIAGIDGPPAPVANVQVSDDTCRGFSLKQFINHP